MNDARLRRYWIDFNELVAGLAPRFGVTAIDVNGALGLIGRLDVRHSRRFRVVEDVDVSTLDAGHVLPNMDAPNRRGVWFPKVSGVS